VLVEKVLQARRRFAALGASVPKLVSNVVRNITGPALGGVESNDADWRGMLALELLDVGES
jgi:hypothetical protein